MTQAIPPLPQAFAARIKAQLGTEAEAYFEALAQPYTRGLRQNPSKPTPLAEVEGLGDPIPWEANGYYLSAESSAGSHPLHEAGAYYLQEPSAMIPARVLSPMPGERVLDLCAAPGGKSTQLATLLGLDGLLVCNEPIPSRAQVLSRNVERMGIGNALVVCADPSRLESQWPCAFDAILTDAPCSGEGMFRRHPETRLEWTADSPAGCAARQQRILESAIAMLKPGGRLVYSTCTLSPEENEQTVERLQKSHPELTPVDFSIPIGQGQMLRSRAGMLRIYPHQLRGEGHFVALLVKQGDASARETSTVFSPAAVRLAPPSATLADAYAHFAQSAASPAPNAALGGILIDAPPLPPLHGIKVLRAGLHLGTIKGKSFAPDHALALACPNAAATVAITLSQAKAYQRGESLFMEDAPKGYVLLTLHGIALGFAKGSDGQLKNHYPKGLRRPW